MNSSLKTLSPAIFFDRDGVLIEDSHLITHESQVQLIPGIGELLSSCRKLGYLLFMITNQTVVARGLITLEKAIELNETIIRKINTENSMAYFDEVYLCPHHPQAELIEFRQNCLCRKPKPGMILAAKEKYQLDLKKSFLIGDRISDIIAGNMAGVRTILFNQHPNFDQLIETDLKITDTKIKEAHFQADKVQYIFNILNTHTHEVQGRDYYD
jgi:D-glycero-D-manno-heptose 1,7-bisphosphate phosphatase